MGFASCDPGGILATAQETVNVAGVRDAAKQAAAKAQRINAEKIVVGMPLKTDGEKGSRAEKTEAFVEVLKGLVTLPIETFDERFTTVVAHRFLSDSGLKTEKHKGLVDAVSAAIILQDYLDRNKKQ